MFTVTECRTQPAIGIARCKKEIAAQAAVWIAEWIGISTAADIIKVIAGIIIGAATSGTDDLIDLDEALTKLAEVDKTKAELVKLRYFAGLTLEQAARLLDISPTTAKKRDNFLL